MSGIGIDGEKFDVLFFNETNNGNKFGFPHFYGYRTYRFKKYNDLEQLILLL